jgi:molybdopterin molybdotransferase
MALLPVSDALERLLASCKPMEKTENVALHQAAGRVLARDLAAGLTQPPFDASAMDGYAVKGAEVAAIGAKLSVIGESAAGHGFEGRVGQGQAVRIFTGAPMPEGADSVLLQEDAEKLGDGRIRANFALQTGRHVRPRGQDFAEGEIVLKSGMELDPGRLVLAAGMNHAEIVAYRKPLVALIATGDELLPPGSVLGESQIIASNTFGVAALAFEAGAEVIDLGIVPDDRAMIRAAIERAEKAGADVIVTLGGASVGDHDLVQETMIAAGMTLDFWKIAMRPGKPLMVGNLGPINVLGLPGNPVSSMVCALLFLEPLIRKLAHKPAKSRIARAITALPLKANDHRQDHLRATLERNDSGQLIAHHFDKQDSSMMKIFALADCLIVRPSGAPALPEGAPCEIMVLRQPGA